MRVKNAVDILENDIAIDGQELLGILLKDRTTNKNIIWATGNYSSNGLSYQFKDQICILSITGDNGNVIKPRTEKLKTEQTMRIREKAEVFTPSSICNKQNNLIDNAWFGKNNIFNVETLAAWIATTVPIWFPTTALKSWKDYVTDIRLEMTCGEAPYLASRYDTVSGIEIELKQRIGLLDRKLRVVCENTQTEKDWLHWAYEAYKSIYGYDWQGDNILLARENLLFTFVDYYFSKFGCEPQIAYLLQVADILSWNIWQMDGIRFVIPDSCKETENAQLNLLGEETEKKPCEGCVKNNHNLHTGLYCKIKDWKINKTIKCISLLDVNK